MLDIHEGDIAVIDGKEYPIRYAAEWEGLKSTASFRRKATKSLSTKRLPLISFDGERGLPEFCIVGIVCTPPDPLDADLRKRLMLETPHELVQVFVADGTDYTHLVLEDLKR